ncbi:hypothetical protein F443_12211 [Phytophthora nicotianae P1569]|uniref:WRKY19-like zinc finger domain-containing protein n=1 Tax=Phytophthora nicotianae P1569 TaxID=1317065 RepID=V9EW60_PHYNI|nr:hypothetical protein F443_12211 [Phytophthora nicotianae P1569]
MLDVKTIGANLTPAQQDEVLMDLSFLLDEFGSTRAARTKLQEQEHDIKRLRKLVLNQQVDKNEQEECSNKQDNPPHYSDVDIDVVEETMVNLDFFLRTFGSTRAVRVKLANQKQEIETLERTVQCLQERGQRKCPKIEDMVGPLTNTSSVVNNGRDPGIESGHGSDCETLPRKTLDTVTRSLAIENDQRKGNLISFQSGPSTSIVNKEFLSSEVVITYYAALKTAGAVCGSSTSHFDRDSTGRQRTSSKSKYCRHEGCERTVQLKGLCYRHGGYNSCKVDGCTRKAIKQHLCRQHGGGTKCKIGDCANFSCSGLKGYCRQHGREQGVQVKAKGII